MEQKKNNFFIILAVAIGTFMASLDMSVVTVANPVIEKYFNVSFATSQLVLISYLLIISSTLLAFGRIADLYGYKRVYVTGFITFSIASFLCGVSFSIEMLIAFRIIQALGASMLMSTGTAIVTNSAKKGKRGKSLSVTAISVAVALCTGPVLGGLLVTLLGWKSIFFINVPIGIIGSLIAFKKIPKDTEKKSQPFDVIGSILIFSALILIIFPLDTMGTFQISKTLSFSMIILGIILAVLFLMIEKKAKYPMLNISLFKNRIFAASNIAALFNYMSQFIMLITLINYLENMRKFTPLMTGITYIAMPIATMLVAPISGAISDRFDSRLITTFGMGIMTIGMLMLSRLNINTSLYFLIINLIIVGFGSGLFQTPNNSAVMGNVPSTNRGSAAGTLGTMRNIGMVMGTAIAGALGSYSNSLYITFIIGALIAFLAMLASFVKGKTVNL